MKYQTKFRPELMKDVSEARGWYEDQTAGLGNDFLREFFAAVARIEANPTLFRKAHSDFRRLLLTRFPYFLYYQIVDKTLVFLLLFHCARNPKLVRTSLKLRGETK